MNRGKWRTGQPTAQAAVKVCQTASTHGFRLVHRGEKHGPKTGLHTEDVRLGPRLQYRWNRVETINLLQRQVTAPRLELGRPVERLVIALVSVPLRGQHHVVSAIGRRGRAANPVHDHRVWRQPTVHNFAPADELAAVRGDKFFNAPLKIALQFLFILEALGLDAGLALRAPPAVFLQLHPSPQSAPPVHQAEVSVGGWAW